MSELDNSWGSVFVSCCCEKLVAEARIQLGNPEEGGQSPLEAATKQRLMQACLNTSVCVCVCVCNSEMWSVIMRCIEEPNKSDNQSKLRLTALISPLRCFLCI
jgi:hypothetical protein